MDPTANFGYGIVLTPPSPTDIGVTVVLQSGDGSRFPNPASGQYNVVIKPAGQKPLSSNSEIVRVTGKTVDTFTIIREQENTSARDIVVGDEFYISITKKTIDDINTALNTLGDEISTAATTASAALTAHEADTSTHGVTGDILGTEDVLNEDTMATNSPTNPPSQRSVVNYIASRTTLDGWRAASGETWTYASVDDPIGQLTIPTDLTTKYCVGMKIKFTNNGNTVYGKIVAISFSTPNTTITFLHEIGIGTSLAAHLMVNLPITAPYFSTATPYAFPIDDRKWTVEYTDASSNIISGPSATTWIPLPGATITAPIGLWKTIMEANLFSDRNDNGYASAKLTLSTANNSESNADFTAGFLPFNAASAEVQFSSWIHHEFILDLAVKTIHYLNIYTEQSGVDFLGVNGAYGKTRIKLVCAY